MQQFEQCWAIINFFDPPKQAKIIDYILRKDATISKYKVKYKNRFFEIRCEDVFVDEIEANIFWAVTIRNEYALSEAIMPEMFMTDDFIRADMKAAEILSKYSDICPDIILKYI